MNSSHLTDSKTTGNTGREYSSKHRCQMIISNRKRTQNLQKKYETSVNFGLQDL